MDLGDLTNRQVSDGMPMDRDRFRDVAGAKLAIEDMLSYFGTGKDEAYDSFDDRYGEGEWLLTHTFDGEVIQKFDAFGVYEDAYYHHFEQNPDDRTRIVAMASEVYDIAPSNVDSGLDYTIQENDATHLQDIAVRRALTRLKMDDHGAGYSLDHLPVIPIFEGSELVQIRGHKTKGYFLNPGMVPFHRSDQVSDVNLKTWWRTGSVEDWYQKSKTLLVDPDNMMLRLAIVSPNHLVFRNGDDTFGVDISGEFPLRTLHRNIRGARRLYHQNKECSKVVGSPEKSYSDWMESAPRVNGELSREVAFSIL